jgi:hypothetical protein
MNAIRNLLFRFWPRRIAGAPVTTPAAATAPPTNSRRVIRRPRVPLLEFFISLAPPNPRILRRFRFRLKASLDKCSGRPEPVEGAEATRLIGATKNRLASLPPSGGSGQPKSRRSKSAGSRIIWRSAAGLAIEQPEVSVVDVATHHDEGGPRVKETKPPGAASQHEIWKGGADRRSP